MKNNKGLFTGLIAGVGVAATAALVYSKKDEISKSFMDMKRRLEENPPDERVEYDISDALIENVVDNNDEIPDVEIVSEAEEDAETEVVSDVEADAETGIVNDTEADTETEIVSDVEADAEPEIDYAKENHLLLKKQNRIMYGILACVGGMFLVFVVTAMLLIPHILNILQETEVTIAKVEAELDQLSKVEKIIDDMSVMSQDLLDADIPGLIKDTKALVEDSSVGITDAVAKLESINIEGLNEAISDLNLVAGKMSKLFR